MSTISLITGGFDLLHSGHLALIKSAKEMSLLVAVGLNSDAWLYRKKGYVFMPFEERKEILESLANVHKVFSFNDSDDTACRAIQVCAWAYPRTRTIIFCNGGDRKENDIPEMNVQGISFEFGLGGDHKMNSSSTILKEWDFKTEERVWGKFYNLFTENGLNIKEMIVSPGKGMSFQRHFKRNEIWFVSKGACEVNFSESTPEEQTKINLDTEDVFHVKIGSWHQIINPFNDPCHIIEIQYGEATDEEDIERLSYYEGN